MHAKKNLIKIKFRRPKWLIPTFCLLLLVLIPIASFQIYYLDRIYPGVHIAGIDLSDRGVDQAAAYLNEAVVTPTEVVITASDQKFNIPLNAIEAKYDFAKSAQNAYRVGRSGNIAFDAQQIFTSLTKSKNQGLAINLNEEKLAKDISVVKGAVEVETIHPSVTLVNDKVIIDPGKAGTEMDGVLLRLTIGEHLAFLKQNEIAVETRLVDPSLTPSEELTFQQRAQKVKDKTLKIIFEFEEASFSKDKLLTFLDAKQKYKQELITAESVTIAKKINRNPQNSVFNFDSGRVVEFAPAKDGIQVKTEELDQKIIAALTELETTDQKEVSVLVPVEKTKPEVQTSDVNNLGIKELIGRGSSTFKGSIPTRVYNINLAATRINGTLVKPGEIFSFNNAVGDISKLTGFKEAYVIQDGKTVLGDGGGVCQVSTTLFRAALNAGLPIEERRAHAYRVGYYEQDSGPGLDATIFSPTTDFKFTNNTPGHILIQAKPDTKNLNLVFELYGTSDGRVVTITKPKILSQTAPPPDVYQDDPTLPVGIVKQVEHRAWGAKTVFDYTVTKNGQEMYKKTFTSVYRPWAAVYLRGTGL